MVVLLKAALCLKNKNKQYAYFKQGYFSSDTCVFLSRVCEGVVLALSLQALLFYRWNQSNNGNRTVLVS